MKIFVETYKPIIRVNRPGIVGPDQLRNKTQKITSISLKKVAFCVVIH